MKNLFRQTKTDNSGVVLLVALVILALILFSVLGLSSVLMSEIRSVRYLDNGIVAYYAAESGAERGLFLLRESRGADEAANSALLFDDNVAPRLLLDTLGKPINHRVDDFKVDGAIVDNERLYQYLKISTTSPSFTAVNVLPNTSVQFDIFDPTKESTATTGINQLNVDWQVLSCGTGDQLEISLIEYHLDPVAGLEVVSGTPRKEYRTCGCAIGSTVCNQAQVSGLSTTSFYHVSLKPLTNKASELIATASNGATPIGIPSQINIQTQGKFRDATQIVTIQTPWDQLTSGIFDYVIFTESDLVKNTLVNSLEPFESMCGICTDGLTPCSSAADCGVYSCQAAGATPFCPLDLGNGETVAPVLQTDAGLCNALCTGLTYCGDGEPQTPNGAAVGGSDGLGTEECDDGNTSNKDTCNNSCKATICGDFIIQTPNGAVPPVNETCDDGPFFTGCTVNTCNGCSAVGCCKSDCKSRVIEVVPCKGPDCPIIGT